MDFVKIRQNNWVDFDGKFFQSLDETIVEVGFLVGVHYPVFIFL